MAKKISIGATAAITALCCLATFQGSYLFLQNKFEQKYIDNALLSTGMSASSGAGNSVSLQLGGSSDSKDFLTRVTNKLAEVDSLYRNYYIGDMDDERLIDSVIAGYVMGTGDDYAAYYNKEGFESLIQDLEGEMAGIGVNVIYNTDYRLIEILSVTEGSPADKAGVMPGDLVVTVGEEKESVAEFGYQPSINKLRGEIGTTAIFSVLRGENYSETVDFAIIRDKITEQTVMHHVYGPDKTIGVIKISGFDAKTPVQFVDSVETLQKEGCDKLIIDLRYNPGGELSSIVTTLDYILPSGPIIRIFDADGKEVKKYTSEATELKMPMAVVVNSSTASAAELFTSAVRDYDKATIVGETTYGKGCMQTTVPLSDNSAVSITYRMYSPPFSENYHGIGIVPDVEVKLDEALLTKNIYKITDEEDNQLAAAAATFYD
ncbi:MAG: PDZ domain-containing protein [Clostridia bacterium]|nr:PDZ domain-containing protein [Clostridia bacterium]